MNTKERLEKRQKLLNEKLKLQIEIDAINKKLANEYYAETKAEQEQRWYDEYIRRKCCRVCKHRDAEKDFRIPDGCLCLHPSKQQGKDMFVYCDGTCEFWKQED